jgi:hypothetical protein
MRQGKRFGLSAMQKSDLWCRWKAGQSLHELGVRSARVIRQFAVWCRFTVGLFLQSVDARSWHSHCLSQRTSLEGLLPGLLLSQVGKPSIQDRQATRLNGSERDPHPAIVPRIGYLALSYEVDARVRNP